MVKKTIFAFSHQKKQGATTPLQRHLCPWRGVVAPLSFNRRCESLTVNGAGGFNPTIALLSRRYGPSFSLCDLNYTYTVQPFDVPIVGSQVAAPGFPTKLIPPGSVAGSLSRILLISEADNC